MFEILTAIYVLIWIASAVTLQVKGPLCENAADGFANFIIGALWPLFVLGSAVFFAAELVQALAARFQPDPKPQCCYCDGTSEGEHTIHRDGFLEGPRVPLCNACAQDPELSCEIIWEKIAQPSAGGAST